jgi:hypothetical protein
MTRNRKPLIAKDKDTGKWMVITDYINHRNGDIEVLKDHDVTEQMERIIKTEVEVILASESCEAIKELTVIKAIQEFKVVNGNCDEGCDRAEWSDARGTCTYKECPLPLGLKFVKIN